LRQRGQSEFSPLNIPAYTRSFLSIRLAHHASLWQNEIEAKPVTFENTTAVSQLRVLQVSAEPVLYLGGVGKIVQWLIRDLSTHYRISLAAPDAGAPNMPEELATCLEKRISIPQTKWDRESKRAFLKQVKAGQYDLIHFHGGTFSFDAHLPWRSPLHPLCLARVPWITSNHCAPFLTAGLFPPGYPRSAKTLKAALAWSSKCFLLTFCGQEVFDSKENEGQISRWFPWAKAKLSTIYHSGLEAPAPRPVVSREVVTIGNLGHIASRKGQQDLLAAFVLVFRKFPHLRLVLAGPDGGDGCLHWVRNEISRLNLGAAVELPGGLSDKASFWKAVDIYVQPSHFEGAPIALMEALWLGKPAIGTKVSGIPEIIESGVSGLLVEPGKPEAMAAAIEKLVLDFDLRRRFCENGPARILAQGMTRRQMSRKYADLYDRVLAGHRHRQ
jgi:glycosyltransferase involved in cell wall biosynthesis